MVASWYGFASSQTLSLYESITGAVLRNEILVVVPFQAGKFGSYKGPGVWGLRLVLSSFGVEDVGSL